MTDLRQGIVIILGECLDLPRNRVTEIQEHAGHFLASIKAGASTDALRMQVAKIQMTLGDVVNHVACRGVVARACALVAKKSN